jgi:hypothetical protein
MTSDVVNADKCCASTRWPQRIDGKIVGLPVVISKLVGGRYQRAESASPNSSRIRRVY